MMHCTQSIEYTNGLNMGQCSNIVYVDTICIRWELMGQRLRAMSVSLSGFTKVYQIVHSGNDGFRKHFFFNTKFPKDFMLNKDQ